MAEKRHILFVDDEQNVLDGLRRLLRPMRAKWDMAFANSGREALDILDQQPCDVIVSDMRMPGMSGDVLLGEVQKRHPAIARLVLSGQADRDEILKDVGPIHQFLQKPCDADTLISTIKRICDLDDLFENESLKSMVTAIESLPSLPSHQEDLLAKLQTPNVSSKVIGAAISQDMAMTAKILQLVNSSFFSLCRHIGSPADAVSLLGLDTVRSLALSMQVFSQVSPNEIKGFSQDALLAHSVKVAMIARKIAMAQGLAPDDVEEAYLAGLLHDVGKLVFASQRPKEFAEAVALTKAEQLSDDEAERRAIGASHGEIGGFLLGLWAFSSPIVDATTYHHCPRRHLSHGFTILTAVHVANAIVRFDSHVGDTDELEVDMEHLTRIGLSDRLAVWRDAGRRAA